ncbi:MAG: DUF885 family protein [Clostridia bacterium]|nr:DUF885 family protein [Clostridia bacterium]
MIKKLLSFLLASCFILGVISCSGGKTPEGSPLPTSAPTAEAAITDAPTAAPETAVPVIKSAADEEFEKLSDEIFVSIATSDGFTYHQFIKDPSVYGIDESEVERGWGSLSLEAHEADIRENDEILNKLSKIDRQSLTRINANAYDTLVESIELANEARDFYYYSEPLETLNGNHTMLPLMMTMYEISSKEDLDGYMYLLEDMPRYIGEIADFEIEKAQRGLFMSENALDTVLESIEKFIDSKDDCFLIGFIDDILEKDIEGLSAEEAAAYSARNRECVLGGIMNAYSDLKETIATLRDKCGAFIGACDRSNDEKRYFVSSIKNSAACDMEPDEMEDLLDETATTLITKLMQIIYSDRNAINDFGKTITSGKPEDDIVYLLELIKSIYPMIPEQKIEYISVPEAVADDFSPAAYLVSAFDDPSRNIVITNPTADTRTLLLTMAHECFPGHLYQTQYVRNGSFPLAQQIVSPSGYSEGWAVFSELMIASRAERYGVNACLLEQYNSIACNIVFPAYISLKVNYNGWDKNDIDRYLTPYGLNDPDYIDTIYEYAVNMPDYFFNYAMGFACTYSIYHKVNPKTDAELKSFFSDYLSLGPCCFDVLFKHFGVQK